MVKPVAPGAAASKDKVPRKAARKSAADEKSAGTVKPAKKRAAAPRKRARPPEPVASCALGPEERHHLIEVAAYYVAERRGFHGASSHEDWLQAESEIDAMIAAGKFAP